MSDVTQSPAPQTPMSKRERNDRKLAEKPEKVLFYIWMLFALGLVQRFVFPALAGSSGLLVIMPFLVLLVLAGPAYLTWIVLHYNKKVAGQGKVWLIGSAAFVTIFGLYLFAWAV